jgi:hypothetical protein
MPRRKFWKFLNLIRLAKNNTPEKRNVQDSISVPEEAAIKNGNDTLADKTGVWAEKEPVKYTYKVKETDKANDIDKVKKLIDLRDAFSKFTGAVGKSHNERNQADIERAKEQIKEALSLIEVIAFIGSSGTGKSTRAIRIAKDMDISYIIDDGLLINGGRVVAGLSAKRAKSKLESVRQALYVDENRAEGMRRALGEHLPDKLMILGTSDGMLEKICDNLWLNRPAQVVRIEDVTTEEERRTAVFFRSTQGQHTIPVPSMEIKHEFSGYFSDPLNRLLRRRDKNQNSGLMASDFERTVVRPTFSTLGSYSISDEAMADIVRIILKRKVPGVAELLKFQIEKQSYGNVLYMELSLYYGYNAQDVLQAAQNEVSSGIEDITSINIMLTNVKAKRLIRNTTVAQSKT